MKLIIDTKPLATQVVVAGQVLGLLAKAVINRVFHSQTVSTSNIDVTGFENVYEYKGVPSVQPGFVLVASRKLCNGYVQYRDSVKVTTREWKDLCDRVAFGRPAPSIIH